MPVYRVYYDPYNVAFEKWGYDDVTGRAAKPHPRYLSLNTRSYTGCFSRALTGRLFPQTGPC
jgi:hypothetical protein